MKIKNIISAVLFVLCIFCVDSSVSQGLPTTNTKYNKCNLSNDIYLITYVLQYFIFILKWDIPWKVASLPSGASPGGG